MKIKKVLVVASTSLLCFHSIFFPVISTSTPIFAIEQSKALPKEPELLDPLENTTETQAPTFSFEENKESYTAGQQFFLVIHVSQEVSEFVMDLPKGVSIVEDQQSTDIQFANIEGNQWQVKANSPQVTFSIPLVVEKEGTYEITVGKSKTMLNIQPEESQQTTDQEIISSEEKEPSNIVESIVEDEMNTNQETEDHRVDAAKNGMWGTVSWTWESSARTITLQGGTAGSLNSSPWRIHTDVVRIIVGNRVILPANSGWLFWSLPNLERIDNAERFDTSNVTNMNNMFGGSPSLKTLDLSNWDTSNVTDMGFMFNGARNLETLNVSNWNTSNVTSMRTMFQNAESLTGIDVSSWNTSSVTDMGWMFNRARNLETLNVSNWNTTNVSEATSMFFNTTNLSELHLGTRSRFDHLASPPTMPTITSSDNYTGSWVYYLNQANTIPEAYITSSSANFWREYDGSNPGTYQWQKKGSVAVHYRDINDQEIIASEIITGGIREPFQIEEKAIEGYKLQEIPDNTSGRFTEEEQPVIFRYMKNAVNPVDPLNPEIEVDPESKPNLPEDQGLLSIDFVSSFNFGSQSISVNDQTYYAQPQRLLNEDGTVKETEERPNYVQISDRRPESERNGWELAVTQQEQFKGKENQVLTGASITLLNQQVVTAQGGTAPELQSVHPLIPGNRQRLLKAQGSEGMGTWIYRFGDAETVKESVALNVPKGANPEATTYSTKLTWELSSVPDN
ncbi:WxL domain-containing protein [Enterococcus sp. AZ162]|uniref:WxL domain-containing protein n=1 Tax=unclassified Enterococcus TaxID=2608891 RepID=UPI003F2640DC